MVLHMVRGERIDQRELIRRLTEMQYSRNDVELRRATYRVRGEVIDVHPAESEMEALRIELFDGEIENLAAVRSAHRRDPAQAAALHDLPEVALRHHAPHRARRDRDDQGRDARAAGAAATRENKLVEAQRLSAAHPVRPGDDGRGRLLQRHRELLAAPDRAHARRAAAVPVRLPAAGCAAGGRRIARDRAAARRDVQGRPLAQGDAGRIRLPAAVGARQPAAEVRGMGAAARRARSSSRRRRASTRCEQVRGAGGRTGGASDRPDRSRSRDPPGRAPRSTTCSARSTCAWRWATACWSPR